MFRRKNQMGNVAGYPNFPQKCSNAEKFYFRFCWSSTNIKNSELILISVIKNRYKFAEKTFFGLIDAVDVVLDEKLFVLGM